MTYRSDQDAQDDQARARIVRIRGELHELEARLGTPSPAQRDRWIWALGGAIGGGILTTLGIGAMLAVSNIAPTTHTPVGAPDAPRSAPERREVDVELLRLHDEMRGCAPAGFDGRIQTDVTFEGSTGAIADVQVLNEGATTLEMGMLTCVEQTFARIGVPRFRNAEYLYRTTLVWTEGRLTIGEPADSAPASP